MRRLLDSLVFITFLIIMGCEKGEIVTAVDPLVELHAVHVTSRPVVDGRDDDLVWQNAIPYTVRVGKLSEDGNFVDIENGFNVTAKAIWWQDWMKGKTVWIERPFISIFLTWPDDTKDIHKNAWYYNPQDSLWTHSKNGTDWILFIWASASELTDLWYWDASLTNPLGYAEDQFIQTIRIDTAHFVQIFNIDGTNVLNDFGEFQNTWDKNYNNNRTPRDSTDDYPKMAWKFDLEGNTMTPFIPRIYQSSDEKTFFTTNEKYSFLFESDADLIENTPYLHINRPVMIPGQILKDPIGPSGDIMAVGRHENGYWTVELVRPTATDDEDANDIGFVPSSRYSVYYFNIAIGNNTSAPFERGSQYYIGSDFTSFTIEFIL